ncbi:MAG: Quinolinate synthetase, partial [uncultured Solirubrobacteraceae bacterium]
VDSPSRPRVQPRAHRRGTRSAARRGPRAQGRAQRDDPRAQLPAAGDPGHRRPRRRLAGAVTHRRRRRPPGHRLLRRPLHGRDRRDLLPREDGAHPRSQGRLLARRLDHSRPAARLEGSPPRCRRGDVRQHDRRGQGRDRLLRDVVERRRGGRAHLPRARRRHPGPVRPGHVPRLLRGQEDRALDPGVGRRVPRARRHPPGRSQRPARPDARRRAARAPRMRLLDPGHGIRRQRRRRRAGDSHAVHRRHDAPALGDRRSSVHRRHRDRHPAPPAPAASRSRVRAGQPQGGLPVHEDDHAAQAARRPSRHAVPGDGRSGRRRACPSPDRADAVDRRL